MSFQRHGDGHAAIRSIFVLFVVLALSACGSDQAADSGSDDDQNEAVSADGQADDGSSDELTVTTAPSDEETSSDDSREDEGGEDVSDIDPDEIELNPDAVNPADKSTSTSSTPATSSPTTAPATSATGPATTASTPDKSTPTTPTPADGSYDSALEPLVQQAKNDLAARLSVDSSTIAVHSAKSVTWPDASVGCPRPGMVYAQVVTDGTEIMLTSQGAQHRYTNGGSLTAPTLCEA